MIEKYCNKFAVFITLNSKYKDIRKIEFGLKVLAYQLLLFLSMIFIAGIVFEIQSMLFFMIPLVLIRSFVGGFHFVKFWLCVLFTNLICFSSIFIAYHITSELYLLLQFISCLIIFISDPLANNCRKKRIAKKNQKIGRILTLITIAFSLFLFKFNYYFYANVISLSLFVVSISIIFEKINYSNIQNRF